MLSHFLSEGFLDNAINKAKEYNVDTSKITFELTETEISADDNSLSDIFHQIRHEGFKISIDDFGVGSASFDRLLKLEFDELKLDKSFVEHLNLHDNKFKNNKLIEMIYNFLLENDTRLIIEGVETNEQYLYITSNLSRAIIQGYFLSKPQNIDDLLP